MKYSKIWCWGGTWPKKMEETGGWKKLPNKELDDLYSHQILGWSSPGQWDGWSTWHIWGKRAIHAECRRGNVKEQHHWGSISFSALWDLLCSVLVIYITVVDLPGIVELFILVSFMLPNISRYSWVSIITSCCLDDGFILQLGQGVFCFLSFTVSRLVLKPTQTPIHWILYEVLWLSRM
jgi:hypothetical protein